MHLPSTPYHQIAPLTLDLLAVLMNELDPSSRSTDYSHTGRNFPPPENPRPHLKFLLTSEVNNTIASPKLTMYRPVTPQNPSQKPRQHYTTPTKAAVLAAVDFCQKFNTPYYKEDVFRTFNVNRRQGFERLRSYTSDAQ